MDTFQLHYVNHYEAAPGAGSQVRMTSTHPYVRLQCNRDAPLYVKDGVICGDSGAPVEESKLPAWFWDQARLINPELRRAVKLVLPEEREAAPAPSKPARTPVVAAPSTGVPAGHWACPETGCGAITPIQKKGVHIAAHRRSPKRQVTVVGAV